MAFPQTALGLRVELYVNAAWTDITSDVRGEQQIRISRGRQDEGASVEPTRCSLTLDNRAGTYSPRNPNGSYYGQIGRNTPLRVSVLEGESYLDLGASGYATTVDDASLDITGDIDVRVDATLDAWTKTGTDVVTEIELAAKRGGAGQLSWVLTVENSGLVQFTWSTDGTATSSDYSTAPIVVPGSGRLAVRATLDVDNGSSQHVLRFYTSDTISGTWTQLGSDVTRSGTTSIFASTAAVEVGALTNEAETAPTGKVHAFALLNGIGGTEVANPDWTAQASGTTSFVDAAGRTWTLGSDATITNRKVRFSGEISSWPVRWDTGGFDATVQVEASGIMRRLGQGASPLKSSMLREVTNPSRSGVVGYWPCEDGANATAFGSGLDGHLAGRIVGSVTRAAYSDWAASAALPTITSGSVKFPVPSYTETGTVEVWCFVQPPSGGVSSTQRLLSFSATGSARTWSVLLTAAGDLSLRAYDLDGVTLYDSGAFGVAINGKRTMIAASPSESGADILVSADVYDIDATTLDTPSVTSHSGSLAGQTLGRVTQVRLGEDGDMDGTAFGHVIVADSLSPLVDVQEAMIGWDGETAVDRIIRLTGEEELTAVVHGVSDEQVGPQTQQTLLTLLREAADADHGILYEAREDLGLQYRDRWGLENQAVVMTLDYEGTDGLVTPLDPVDDDQHVRNDRTVQRQGGASARRALDTGALSTLAPPNGVGRYDDSVTLALFDDDRIDHHAGWLLHQGTWDETRYPVVRVNLAGAPASINAAASVDIGDRIQITNPPAWLPPDTIDLMVQGYTEILANFEWTIEYNCTPAGPWNVGRVEDDVYSRFDTSGSELAEALDTTETAVDVLTTSGPVWTTNAAEFPFDIRVGGEVMTVSDCDSLASDTFTRSETATWGTSSGGAAWATASGNASDRSVNGTQGVVTIASGITTIRFQTLASGLGDCEVRVKMSVSQVATGASLVPTILLRYTDTSNYYRARLHFGTGGSTFLSVTRDTTQIGSTVTLPYTYTAGAEFWVRARLVGHTVQLRAWPTSYVEPNYWQCTETVSSSTIATGAVGVTASGFSGNTNVSPEFRFDDYEIVTPQTMTVTRSVNGVVKSHSSGADVALAHPTILAL